MCLMKLLSQCKSLNSPKTSLMKKSGIKSTWTRFYTIQIHSVILSESSVMKQFTHSLSHTLGSLAHTTELTARREILSIVTVQPFTGWWKNSVRGRHLDLDNNTRFSHRPVLRYRVLLCSVLEYLRVRDAQSAWIVEREQIDWCSISSQSRFH